MANDQELTPLLAQIYAVQLFRPQRPAQAAVQAQPRIAQREMVRKVGFRVRLQRAVPQRRKVEGGFFGKHAVFGFRKRLLGQEQAQAAQQQRKAQRKRRDRRPRAERALRDLGRFRRALFDRFRSFRGALFSRFRRFIRMLFSRFRCFCRFRLFFRILLFLCIRQFYGYDLHG